MKYLTYMKTTDKNRFTRIAGWIEKVIESCDHSKLDQEKVCDKLITNLTNSVMFVTNDPILRNKLEKKLRKKLFSKFYRIKK